MMLFKIFKYKTLSLSLCCFLLACGDDNTSTTHNSNETGINDNQTSLSTDVSTDSLTTNTATTPETTNTSTTVETSNVPTQTDATTEPEPLSATEPETLVDNRDWQRARGWTNFDVENQLQGIVTISFDVRATEDNINGVAAVTSGTADEYDDLALIFRMNMDGFMDARDGDSYQSETNLAYKAGEVYTVVMDADFNSNLYDVFVIYPNEQRFPVRLSASFRESQTISSANQLVIYEALNDQLEVSNFMVNNREVYLVENTSLITPTSTPTESETAPTPQTTENNTNSSSESFVADPTSPLIDPSLLSFDADTHFPNLPRVEVRNSTELANAVRNHSEGARIYIHPGNYGCLDLSDRNYSQTSPLLLEGLGTSNTDVVFNGSQCSHTIEFNNSSYIRIKHVSTQVGLDGVSSYGSSNLIIDGLNISLTRQGGIHIGRNSSNIDIINNEIYNTGIQNSQWGECIYIGTGGSNNFPDVTERVWIENNHIHHCGYGEGINIKPEVFNTTARANYIHDIRPGNPNHSQYNHAAITIEPGRGNDYQPNIPREIWIENNVIENVTRGRWAYGIMSGGTGTYLIGNDISNFEESGIWVSNYNDLGSPVYVYNNTINTNVSGSNEYRFDSGVNVLTNDTPINNPNQPLNWESN